MNKKVALFMALGLITARTVQADCVNDSCDCDATSRTYLSVRPQFQSVDPIYLAGFRNDRLHAYEEGWEGALQVVVFGSRSTKEERLARYFLPFCKTEVVFNEELGEDAPSLGAALGREGDIQPTHFNIVTTQGTFKSRVSFSPKQTTFGVGFHYRQSFFCNDECGRGFWASVSFPIVRIKNDIGFCEEIENDGGSPNTVLLPGAVGSVREAFKQEAWLHGKIFDCPSKKTGVADVELKLGYEWLQHEPCHLESYIGIIVPTGNRVDADELFQPIVGNGRHFGVMFGSAFGANVWCSECSDRSLRIEYAIHSQYLFEKEQQRSFDLKGKPWSRYIQTYANKEQALQGQNQANNPFAAVTPGINVLTQCVKVTPGFSHNMTTALVYDGCWFTGEIGYNLYARRAECVKLAQPWQEGPAIKARDGIGQVNPLRDITGNFFIENATIAGGIFPVDQVGLPFYDLVVIKESDLDLVSASSPCGLSQTIYGALTMDFDSWCRRPVFVNIGGSYEFANKNNGMINRWTIWAKGGISF